LLTIETGDDAQGAVRGWVLRPNVERHALGFKFNIQARVGSLTGDIRQTLTVPQ
jgi:hypothetical protein